MVTMLPSKAEEVAEGGDDATKQAEEVAEAEETKKKAE